MSIGVSTEFLIFSQRIRTSNLVHKLQLSGWDRFYGAGLNYTFSPALQKCTNPEIITLVFTNKTNLILRSHLADFFMGCLISIIYFLNTTFFGFSLHCWVGK